MYGYVVVNKPELKIKEYDMYRSYYCGLCEELLSDYGINGQISISYDMTFLLVLLTGCMNRIQHIRKQDVSHTLFISTR